MSDDNTGRWALAEHVALLGSVAVAVLVVAKVLAVARYEPSTALAVLAASGTSQVVFGSLAVYYSTLLGVAFIGLTLGYVRASTALSRIVWAVGLVYITALSVRLAAWW